MRFCRWGTSSIGKSMPRSPRATMTPSAAASSSSRWSTAARVSILAMSLGPSGPSASRTRASSSGVRTNDIATQSACRATLSISSRSSSVGTDGSHRSDGRWAPGRPWIRPPLRTTARTSPPDTSTTTSVTVPSPSTTLHPGLTMSTRCSSSTVMRSGPLAPSPATSTTRSPSARKAPPSGKGPVRTLGPGRSARTPTVRPRRSAVSRTRAMRARCSSAEPWARPRRTTSTPASSRSARTSGLSDAGPRVATIFVRRMGRVPPRGS